MSVSAYDDSSGVEPFGITSSGVQTEHGICACGPSYEFGTLFVVLGMGTFRCEDRGSLITDYRLDLWMPRYEDAIEFGRHEMSVIVMNPTRRNLKAMLRRQNSLRGEKRVR